MSGSALLVTLYYGLLPLLVVVVSWLVIKRDYGDRPEERDVARNDEAGGR